MVMWEAEGPAVVVIVDDPDSRHGRSMSRCARLGDIEPIVKWIVPSLRLPDVLCALSGVAAVALPLGVRGATDHDRFTKRLANAIRSLETRGIPVYVAAGTRRPNLLARAGIAVAAADVPPSKSTSEACVRAAARAAILSRSGNTSHSIEKMHHGQCRS